jgi:hypothetical protein
MQHIARRKRKEDQKSSSSHQQVPQQYQHTKVQQLQYSEQFVAMEKDGERQVMPEFTYGEDWQNMNFVRFINVEGRNRGKGVLTSAGRIKRRQVVVSWDRWTGSLCRTIILWLIRLRDGVSRA